MTLETLVTGTDLNRWANLQEARYRLPLLMRRLMHATIERIQRIGFPAEEGVQLGGWDGIVIAEEGNAFVPDGCSVWELGANRNVKSKADEDYEKRRIDPLGLDPATTTYIFVTPRRWGGKDAWVSERKREGLWREIRAYDADDLEQWLEQAPAVHVWCSILLGKHPAAADDIASFWTDWSEVTKPNLHPRLLTNGRDEAASRIIEWLGNPPSTMAVQADTREEAQAFLAAILQQLPAEERIPYLSRSVIVKESDAWNRLCASEAALLLVPTFDVRDAVVRAVRGGHHVLLPLGRDDSAAQTTVELPRLHTRHAREALQEMGLSEQRAGELAPLARRSLMALRRTIAINREVQQPAWARPDTARALLPALLISHWNDAVEGDRRIIAELARSPYQDVSAVFSRWAHASDPPLRRVGDAWFLVSKEDAWDLLGKYLTHDDLERFVSIALDVFGQVDPSLELPSNQRWMAGVFGKSATYSGALRGGIADSLALMGARSDSIQWAEPLSPQDQANRIVRQVLERANTDWRLWASLTYQLQSLAEAAPGEFLRAAEAGVSGEQPVLASLFEDIENDFFARSSHTGLLWALEVLAWPPAHLSRAALVLATLARLDPGGKLSNRPENSLRGIFLCWHPETTAVPEQRLRVIDMLRRREPVVTWRLMSNLLPKRNAIGHPSAKPNWREWIPDSQPGVTYGELWAMEREIVGRMLTEVGLDGLRWKDLIEHLDNVRPEQHNAIVEALQNIDVAALSQDDRVTIWSALRALIARHREYADTAWALPSEAVDTLQQVYDRFEPDDLTDKYAWLFSNHTELIGPFGRDWHAQRAALAAARQAAVQSILQQEGLPRILSLANTVEQPGELGFAFGTSTFLVQEENAFLSQNLSLDNTPSAVLARGFILGRLQSQDWAWVQNKTDAGVIQEWGSELQATFFASLPFDSRTWDMLETMSPETQQAYWLQVPAWRADALDCNRAVRKLLEHNRPHNALNIMAMRLRDREAQLSASLLAEALEQAVRTVPEEARSWQSLMHQAGEILELIEASGQVDPSRIAALEFTLLPFLEHEPRGPKLLHRELSHNPAFFVEALSLVYRAENEEQRERAEVDATRAHLAYDLLRAWRIVPGTQDDGSLNAGALQSWIQQARELAHAANRGDIADDVIGQVLSAASTDEDGSWPTAPVRDVLEQSSEELHQGFVMGVYNRRGGWTKAIAEGGVQERKLAETYHGYAEMIRDQWPHTAAVLQDIANIYSSEARREDIRAELEEDLGQ